MKQLKFITRHNELEKKRCPFPTGILKVSLGQLETNINKLKKFANGKAGKKLKFLLPVKGNGYGSGMVPVARFVENKKLCDYLGVAHLEEAYELRQANIKMPILILGQSFYVSEHIAYIVKNDIEQTVSDITLLKSLNTEAKKQKKLANIHLNIDTGMGRLGILADNAPKFIDKIKTCKNIKLAGVMTHFPVADVPNSADIQYTKQQISDFKKIKHAQWEHAQWEHAVACSYHNDNIIFHASNSGGTLEYDSGLFDMIRPGIATYGYPEPYGNGISLGLKPIMELTARIALIKTYEKGSSIGYGRTYTAKKDERIAIVPIGYADGLDRKLGNGRDTPRRVLTTRVPTAGRISMDQFSVIIDKKSKVGDTVVVMGKGNTARDIADQIGTIPYEILCAFGNAKRLRHEWRY